MGYKANVEATAVIEVACPHCAACWALPAERIGPGGARVHCARCEGAFEWRLARRGAERSAPRLPTASPVAERITPMPPAASPVAERITPMPPTASPVAERAVSIVPPAASPVAARAASAHGLSGWDLDTWLEDAAAPPRPRSAVDELDPSDVTPELVARLAVEELVSTRAEELLDAYDRGTLFARFGPALIGAWSRCRARLGATGDPEVFRAALRARLGIDLPGWEDRG